MGGEPLQGDSAGAAEGAGWVLHDGENSGLAIFFDKRRGEMDPGRVVCLDDATFERILRLMVVFAIVVLGFPCEFILRATLTMDHPRVGLLVFAGQGAWGC